MKKTVVLFFALFFVGTAQASVIDGTGCSVILDKQETEEYLVTDFLAQNEAINCVVLLEDFVNDGELVSFTEDELGTIVAAGVDTEELFILPVGDFGGALAADGSVVGGGFTYEYTQAANVESGSDQSEEQRSLQLQVIELLERLLGLLGLN